MEREQIEESLKEMKKVKDNIGMLRYSVKYEAEISKALKTDRDRKIFSAVMKQVKELKLWKEHRLKKALKR